SAMSAACAETSGTGSESKLVLEPPGSLLRGVPRGRAARAWPTEGEQQDSRDRHGAPGDVADGRPRVGALPIALDAGTPALVAQLLLEAGAVHAHVNADAEQRRACDDRTHAEVALPSPETVRTRRLARWIGARRQPRCDGRGGCSDRRSR